MINFKNKKLKTDDFHKKNEIFKHLLTLFVCFFILVSLYFVSVILSMFKNRNMIEYTIYYAL